MAVRRDSPRRVARHGRSPSCKRFQTWRTRLPYAENPFTGAVAYLVFIPFVPDPVSFRKKKEPLMNADERWYRTLVVLWSKIEVPSRQPTAASSLLHLPTSACIGVHLRFLPLGPTTSTAGGPVLAPQEKRRFRGECRAVCLFPRLGASRRRGVHEAFPEAVHARKSSEEPGMGGTLRD